MFWSRYYIPTLKEAPADAEVVSHKLMVRAGMIRKLTAGVYTYLPYGLAAINKVTQVVREEMNRAGAIELLMPSVQPGDLWVESGRWKDYGKELLRFKDRNDREFCLGPTHEEVITDLVRGEIRSYRQLPVNLYQFQTKFRDEIRPRFGLMRGREFIMKDAYSFDRDDAGADKSYKLMYDAYHRAFTRLALDFKSVQADSGSIGGSFSHEFMVLAKTGEDDIATCTCCEYAANLEKAEVKPLPVACDDAAGVPATEMVDTPNAHSVNDVAAFMNIAPQDILKTMLFVVDGKNVAILVRGDRSVNEIKVKKYFAATSIEPMDAEMVTKVTGAPVGFAGPVGLAVDALVADNELRGKNTWVAGANKKDTHVRNLNLLRDAKVDAFADLRSITVEDSCPACGKPIEIPRGIEVGHVFKLGTKYSKTLNATFLDENGKDQMLVMGCYGIGITRVVAACIEQNHDDAGMILPPPLAPFEVLLVNLVPKNSEVTERVAAVHALLVDRGVTVLVDDRDERAGVKFNDADLIGAPMQIIFGSKGGAEAKNRKTGEKEDLPVGSLDAFATAFQTWREKVYKTWKM